MLGEYEQERRYGNEGAGKRVLNAVLAGFLGMTVSVSGVQAEQPRTLDAEEPVTCETTITDEQTGKEVDIRYEEDVEVDGEDANVLHISFNDGDDQHEFFDLKDEKDLGLDGEYKESRAEIVEETYPNGTSARFNINPEEYRPEDGDAEVLGETSIKLYQQYFNNVRSLIWEKAQENADICQPKED